MQDQLSSRQLDAQIQTNGDRRHFADVHKHTAIDPLLIESTLWLDIPEAVRRSAGQVPDQKRGRQDWVAESVRQTQRQKCDQVLSVILVQSLDHSVHVPLSIALSLEIHAVPVVRLSHLWKLVAHFFGVGVLEGRHVDRSFLKELLAHLSFELFRGEVVERDRANHETHCGVEPRHLHFILITHREFRQRE